MTTDTALTPPLEQPFTTQQARDIGITRHRLRSLLLDKTLRRVLHGVYAGNDLPDTIDMRVQAAKLVVKPFVIVCDRTAAWLYGVDTLKYRELEILPPIDTCVLPSQSRVRREGCQGHERDLEPPDIIDVGGLQVTSPLRTGLDLGCALPRRTALATLDWFLRLEHFTQTDLQRELRRFAGRRGVVQLRELVAIADGRAESPRESWARLVILDAGLPVPELQWSVCVDGIEVFRLDLAYPKHRLYIEYDGEEFHDNPDQRRHDEERRAWLARHGWTGIILRKGDFTDEAIARWTAEMRRALGL
ncbi:MAG: hypothetical protein ACRDQA_18090 [Nocardioidaceae bacterium]